MFRWKIGTKILSLFLVVALLPMLFLQIYWYRTEVSSMLQEAKDHQSLIVTNSAESVNRFLDDKINVLIIHSQSNSLLNFDIKESRQNLLTLIKQDSDIVNLTLVDQSGRARVSIDSNNKDLALKDLSQSDAFKVTTFLSGKEYISEVAYDGNNMPHLTIAVPLLSFENRQTLSQLSTAEPGVIRSSTDIKGVLMADVSLVTEWTELLQQHIGHDGVTYVVDAEGDLIGHSDSSKQTGNRQWKNEPSVARFLKNPDSQSSAAILSNSKGVSVLSAYHLISRSRWGVISEEPMSSISAPANTVGRISLLLFIGSAMVVAAASTLLSRQITKPIRSLADQARRISEGNLDVETKLTSQDELGTLSTTVNTMSRNLKMYIQRISTESDKLYFVLNSVHEGILAIDADYRIQFANTAAATMAGSTQKDIVGKPFYQLYNLEKDDAEYKLDFNSFAIVNNVTLRSTLDKAQYIDLIVNKIENDPTGMVAIVTMIDRTKETEVESMKLDFVTMAAHELRTPMTAIRGYLSLASKDPLYQASADNIKRYIQRASMSSMQLVGLINNLLSVSRIERGAYEMNLNKADWSKILQDIVADQQISAQQRKINLQYEGPSDPVNVIIDETAMREVVNNLINNAMRYVPADGKITVILQQLSNGELMTSVRDNGVGISEENQKRLFSKFFHAVGGIGKTGGTGLGLFIAREIVELHHGRIWVESKEGNGTTFRFTLPPFDDKTYQEIINAKPVAIRKSRGWATKSTTR